MTSLPTRAARDVRTLVRTPAALTAALGFVAAAVLAIVFFPGEPIAASESALAAPAPSAPNAPAAPGAGAPAAPGVPAQVRPAAMQQLEDFISKGPRVPLLVPNKGEPVVIVKFNDYQCPPCRQTYLEYKPILAKLQQQYPGKILFVTRDFPLETECNKIGVNHLAACEAAVAVRLAREKGKAEAMEDYLFANQPNMTPALVKTGLQQVAGVTNFDDRYAGTLELVKGDITQGLQLQVNGTPTFFMNGLRLPSLRGEYFENAVLVELRRVGAIK
jgi:protein-disulfide isomerase